MDRSVGPVVDALAAAWTDVARERVARCHGDPDADDEAVVVARHAWVLGPSARDRLGEASERSGLEAPFLAAVRGHLARLAYERVLAELRRDRRTLPDAPLELIDGHVTVARAIADLEAGREPGRRVESERALSARAGAMLGATRERLAEAAEGIRPRLGTPAEGTRATDAADVDAIEPGVAERAAAFLAATDEMRDEALDFLASASRATLRTPFDLLFALRAPELDDLVPSRTRAPRVRELLTPSGLGEALVRHVRLLPRRRSFGLGAETIVVSTSDVRIAPPSLGGGIAGELALFEAAGRALAVLHAHPAAPTLLRLPREGVLGRIIGAMLARQAFEAHVLGRGSGAPANVLDRARRTAASTSLLTTRLVAAATLVARGEDAEEFVARALGTPTPAGLAGHLGTVANAGVRFDAARLGLALHRALRERYDEAYLRAREPGELLRRMLARVTVERPHVVVEGLGLEGDAAPRELAIWFEGRYR